MTLITYPLNVATFFQNLLVAEIVFDAPPQLELNQTAGGEQMAAEIGPQLWTGVVTLAKMTRAETSLPEVFLDLLRRPAGTFLAFDTRRPAPIADPNGVVIGNTVPLISALAANSREMSLSGLPAGYVLTRGDYLSWAYNSGRQALHRVAEASSTASAGGVTPPFEVTPPIRPGSVAGTGVVLRRAACLAKLKPGTVTKGRSQRTITEGMSFEFVQTLRQA